MSEAIFFPLLNCRYGWDVDNSYPLPRLKATEASIRVFEAQWYILMQLGLESESVRSEQATAV